MTQHCGKIRAEHVSCIRATPMGVDKKGCQISFCNLDVLAPMNNVFASMIDVKMDVILIIQCFLLKNIIKLTKYMMKYSH